MLDSVAKYVWNVAADRAYAEWIGNMQNADHYNNLHILMPVFLLLNFLSSFTIHFQWHKDKNWENMSCLPTFIYKAMSYSLFLLECRARCERNIGTNGIFVRVLNLSSLLLPSSLPLSHLSEAEQRHTEEDKKPVHLHACWGLLHLCARKACSTGKNLSAPKLDCQTELVVMGGHRHTLLQDSLPSQSLPAGNLLQLMEKEETLKLSA